MINLFQGKSLTTSDGQTALIEWFTLSNLLVSVLVDKVKQFYVIPVSEVHVGEVNLSTSRFTPHGEEDDITAVIQAYEELVLYPNFQAEAEFGGFHSIKALSDIHRFIAYSYSIPERKHHWVINTSAHGSKFFKPKGKPEFFWCPMPMNQLINDLTAIEEGIFLSDVEGLFKHHAEVLDFAERFKAHNVEIAPLNEVINSLALVSEVDTNTILTAAQFREIFDPLDVVNIPFIVKGITGNVYVVNSAGELVEDQLAGIDTTVLHFYRFDLTESYIESITSDTAYQMALRQYLNNVPMRSLDLKELPLSKMLLREVPKFEGIEDVEEKILELSEDSPVVG